MAASVGNLINFDDDALKSTFTDTKDTLDEYRHELLMRGYWVDAKYKITKVTELDDDHLTSIIRMLKNQSINKGKWHKGLNVKTWEEFITEHPAYPYLFREANDRNLPGAAVLPGLHGNGVI